MVLCFKLPLHVSRVTEPTLYNVFDLCGAFDLVHNEYCWEVVSSDLIYTASGHLAKTFLNHL